MCSFLEIMKVVIQGLGLISLIFVFVQLRFSNKWKRLEFSIDGKWDTKINEKTNTINDLLPNGLFDYSKRTISNVEFETLINDDKILDAIRDYLNYYEEIACLIENNALDKNYSYSNFSSNLIRIFEYFEKVINEIRKRDNDPYEYLGIRKLYIEWKKKSLGEKKIKLDDIQKTINGLMNSSNE
jgi:hypothetical protein